jgi:Rieske Fe-S protein
MINRLFSRRRAIRLVSVVLLAPLAVLLRSLTERVARLQPRSRRVVIPADSSHDTFFAEGIIMSRSAGQLHILSARCTHLGCLISREIDGLLVCPCHGSRFRPDGSVAVGPATRSLDRLPYWVDAATGAITVQVG